MLEQVLAACVRRGGLLNLFPTPCLLPLTGGSLAVCEMLSLAFRLVGELNEFFRDATL